MERNYEFRKRLSEVHQKDRRDASLRPAQDELALDDNSVVVIPANDDPVFRRAALDLQDYLWTSMGVNVRISSGDDVRSAASSGSGRIVYATRSSFPDRPMGDGDGPRGFRIDCDRNIVITGNDSRGAMQGGFWLEDWMSFRGAPYLKKGSFGHRPLFSPRMVHSGYGLDAYPDAHIASIAHAGMDAILVFVKSVDTTPHGYLDFNDLCRRAAAYGVDVYAYSYLVSEMHPQDPGAEAYYDRLYGSVFAACPALKGVVLVGESVEFPSRDPHTTGRLRLAPSEDGLPNAKPSPGWWPCSDYPQWVSLVRDSVRKHKADADIVFWTYNWGYVEERHRLKLIDTLPTDISLLVTFEMFENVKTGPVTSTCVDYTLMFEGPGRYFQSEAERAKERGIRLYSMVNTGGLTWDIGVIPYEPTPHQWMRRHAAILESQRRYGLCGLMESHHFGFWPSFISDLAKWTYTSGTPEPEQVLRNLAARDFGAENVDTVLRAWSLFSKGIRHYRSTNEDQYGPFRIGPSFPLVLSRPVTVPESPFAMFGNRIFNTTYGPADSGRCSPLSLRIPFEIEYLGVMRDCFAEGADLVAETLPSLPDHLRENGERMANLGRFMSYCAETTINVKRWYRSKLALLSAADPEELSRAVEEMQAIAEAEIANAERTIPLVQKDSRLGWEPSMEYMCDEERLRWKIKQVRQVIDTELAKYRASARFSGG